MTDLAAILATFATVFAMVMLTEIFAESDLGRAASFGAAWLATVCAGVIGGLAQWLIRTVTTLPYVGPLLEAEDIQEKTQYPEFLTLLGLGATRGALAGLIATGPAVLLLTHRRRRREGPTPRWLR